jgi:hypothetical protein
LVVGGNKLFTHRGGNKVLGFVIKKIYICRMKTVNSLSGGKTSSYIAVHYPADYNVFSLVRTDDKSCMFPDAKVRQIVSDKIGVEFIGTLEMDEIIYTMLDLEQFIGSPITWLSPMSFDDLVYGKNKKGGVNMPSQRQRNCTFNLKVRPIEQFWFENINEPVEMRIGFRANEMSRASRMTEKTNKNGFTESKIIVGNKNGRNIWKNLEWRKPSFPLIKDAIFKDSIEEFWKDKPVRFAYKNNCVGCFERNPIFLKHMSNLCPNKFDWFNEVEKNSLAYKKMTWKEGITYQQIKNYKTQLQLFDDDFGDCDSGYCGL